MQKEFISFPKKSSLRITSKQLKETQTDKFCWDPNGTNKPPAKYYWLGEIDSSFRQFAIAWGSHSHRCVYF